MCRCIVGTNFFLSRRQTMQMHFDCCWPTNRHASIATPWRQQRKVAMTRESCSCGCHASEFWATASCRIRWTILSKNWKRFHFGWFSSDYRGNDNFLNLCALLCDLIALHRLILVAIHASLIIRKLTSLMEKFAWEDKDVWWIATFSLAVLEDAKLAWHVLSIFAIT